MLRCALVLWVPLRATFVVTVATGEPDLILVPSPDLDNDLPDLDCDLARVEGPIDPRIPDRDRDLVRVQRKGAAWLESTLKRGDPDLARGLLECLELSLNEGDPDLDLIRIPDLQRDPNPDRDLDLVLVSRWLRLSILPDKSGLRLPRCLLGAASSFVAQRCICRGASFWGRSSSSSIK